VIYSYRMILSVLLLATTSCASLSGSREQYYVCSYDTVWGTTLDTMKGYAVTSQDKDSGMIETAWIETEGKERGYGLFDREGFGNRERARLTVSVKRMNDVSSVSVLETRQRWHARGGATSQATKWWPVAPSDETLDELTQKLANRLKEKGCSAT